MRRYFEKSIVNTKKFQDSIDLHRVWKLIFLSKPENFNPFVDNNWYKLPSDKTKNKQVQTLLYSQIINILGQVKDFDEKIPKSEEMFQEKFNKPYKKTSKIESFADRFLDIKYEKKILHIYEEKGYFYNQIMNLKPDENLLELQKLEQERSIKIGTMLKDNLGWRPFIKDSKIKNAGKGLFIDGKCPQGSIIGFYPGMLYKTIDHPNNEYIRSSKHFIINGSLQTELFFQTLYNQKVFFENDQSKPKFYDFLNREDLMFYKNAKYLGQRFIHPFSNLNFVNHPPKGLLDNVLPFILEIPFSFPRELLPYIPNTYYSNDPSYNDGYLTCLVYISRRNIENEEIYVNYRLDPNQKTPSWYHSLNIEEDERISKKE